MVHLFAGEKGSTSVELKALETGDVAYLEVDILKSKAYDLRGRSSVYKALLWAALRGQVEGILGGPPRNAGEASQELVMKQMFLWMVAKHAALDLHGRNPFFAMELPSLHPFLKGESWKGFAEEYEVPVVETQDAGGKDLYYVARNLDLYDIGVPRLDMGAPGIASLAGSSTWPPWLCEGLARGIQRWRLRPDEVRLARILHRTQGSSEDMSDCDLKKWAQHVRDGHVPFNRRCKTCVETSATGKAHRPVLAPSGYTLSVDVLGPIRAKGETADSKKYKYVLAGSYTMPKLEVWDIPIPEDWDDEDMGAPEVGEDLLEDLFGPDDDGEPPEISPEEEAVDKEDNERFEKIFKEVGDSMEYQVLHFAIPMETRRTQEVCGAVQGLYLQLRAEGLPLVRLHSDRARELRTPVLRDWLRAGDVLQTTGEAQSPQSNGKAERAVKALKTRAKTLLRASGLPKTCWTLAMVFAAWQQRECALGRGKQVLPFGTPVHVRSKVFGTGGKYDLETRWSAGYFVGPSSDVKDGLVVRMNDGKYLIQVLTC